LVNLTASLKEPENASQQTTEDNKEKIRALSLVKECYSMKLEILTNATVVDDAIRFDKSKRESRSLANLRSLTKMLKIMFKMYKRRMLIIIIFQTL
jgi:hypothetical protein